MTQIKDTQKKSWALILGASSGFGAACALELASRGMNIFGVHLDTRANLPRVKEIVGRIQGMGRKAHYFNMNAADADKRKAALAQMQEALKASGSDEKVGVLIHSLAFGTLKPYIPREGEAALTQAQMEMTLDVMAHSLVYWTQDLVARRMMDGGSRIFALTSSGSQRVVPYYGAVSAAKACLEAHIRQLAVELGPMGITANAIRAGITDTPALRKIPGNEELIAGAKAKNPQGRMTTPEDVAKAIASLCEPGAYWITANVIGADGGEEVVGF